MSKNRIFIKGAREHNLKNIDVEIPRDKLVVITGLSGSGKSSLAFDTIYAEGQRRYVESLSAYARQFLGQMEKPDVDYIDGLSPAISIDQKTTSRNPRSTVGTVTEIYDYLRLLYARIGVPHCHRCGKVIAQQSVDQMVDAVAGLEEGARIQLLAPVVRGRKGEYHKLIDDARKNGYVRIRVDGEVRDVGEEIALDKNRKHTIEIVVDRLVIKPGIEKRLADSVETALRLSGGLLVVDVSRRDAKCCSARILPAPTAGSASRSLRRGCFPLTTLTAHAQSCSGLGTLLEIDPDLVVPDRTKSLAEGAIRAGGWNFENGDSYARMYLDALAKHYGV
jgi:excinuclease ABC subunit A